MAAPLVCVSFAAKVLSTTSWCVYSQILLGTTKGYNNAKCSDAGGDLNMQNFASNRWKDSCCCSTPTKSLPTESIKNVPSVTATSGLGLLMKKCIKHAFSVHYEAAEVLRQHFVSFHLWQKGLMRHSNIHRSSERLLHVSCRDLLFISGDLNEIRTYGCSDWWFWKNCKGSEFWFASEGIRDYQQFVFSTLGFS